MTTKKSVEHSNAPQETATDCGYVGCRLSRRRSEYLQTSASRWITTGILLGIMQYEYTKHYSANVSTPLYYQRSIGKETMFPKFPVYPVDWCFQMRCPKIKYFWYLNFKMFSPTKQFGLATPLQRSAFLWLLSYDMGHFYVIENSGAARNFVREEPATSCTLDCSFRVF